MRKMAFELNVSEKTMRNISKTNRNISPIKLQTCHHLTNFQKENRLARAKILQNKMKSDTDTRKIVLSVEKVFNVKAVVNRQNDRMIVFLTSRERFSGTRNRPLSWCEPMFPTHGSLPSFLFHKALKLIPISTLRQF